MKAHIIVFLLSVALTGCHIGKDLEVEKGTLASAEEFQQTAAKAYEGIDPLSMLPGEYARRAQYQRFTTSSTPQETLVSVEGRNVVSREEFDEFVLFKLLVERVEFQGEDSKSTIVEVDEAYERPLALLPNVSIQNHDLQTFSDGSEVYNLTYSVAEMDPPKAAQQALGCDDGAKNCKISVRIIRFDTFANMGGGQKRVSQEYWISSDVPHQAHELKRCLSYTAQVDATFVLITECVEVDDYRYGS